jgi:ABC-type molybdate transport system permease subunit
MIWLLIEIALWVTAIHLTVGIVIAALFWNTPDIDNGALRIVLLWPLFLGDAVS